MLAYRHAFHAGNHADVLKHIVLIQVLAYMNQKDKPYWVIDTHAGAGMYSLQSDYANTKSEYELGIGRLWVDANSPEPVKQYLDLVAACNPNGGRVYYPGSPEIIARSIRNDDRLRAFELHPTDYQILQAHFSRNRLVKTFHQDGFAGLRAVLPPPTRRAVVFMDPPYEIKTDYQKTLEAIKEGLTRFAEGVYIVWYPILTRGDHRRLTESLSKLSGKTLNISMQVQEPDAQGFGMLGSGLFLINPPWNLKEVMAPVMPYLLERLAQYPNATFALD